MSPFVLRSRRVTTESAVSPIVLRCRRVTSESAVSPIVLRCRRVTTESAVSPIVLRCRRMTTDPAVSPFVLRCRRVTTEWAVSPHLPVRWLRSPLLKVPRCPCPLCPTSWRRGCTRRPARFASSLPSDQKRRAPRLPVAGYSTCCISSMAL